MLELNKFFIPINISNFILSPCNILKYYAQIIFLSLKNQLKRNFVIYLNICVEFFFYAKGFMYHFPQFHVYD